MSGIPEEIPDLGNARGTPRQNPEFAPGAEFTTEDYYVWTRCDGRTSVRDIILMVGFGADKGIAILRKLRARGAVLLAGETPESVSVRVAEEVKGRRPRPPTQPLRSGGLISSAALDGDDEVLGDLGAEELVAMAESVALSDLEKRRVILYLRRVRHGTYFDILGVDPSARKRELKRAYFRVSKAFHPDRFYKKQTGSFGPWLTEIFELASKAFSVLSDDRMRRRYEAVLRGESPEGSTSRPQTPEEHAADLFDRACKLEIAGNFSEAMTLFAATVRVDARARYMRRAANCGIKAGEFNSAEQYAKKAAELESDDPSTARVLANVYRAAGKLAQAEQTLLAALELKTENDSLLRGLTADLEAVRRQRAAQ